MDKDRWKFAAEMVAIAAIVASLLFVGLQMKQAENIARYEFFSGADVPADFVEALRGQEEIWLKGCADEEMTDAEMLIFLRLASMHILARNAQTNRVRLLNLSISPEYPAYRMALDLHSNPGLKKTWHLQAEIDRQNPTLTPGLSSWTTAVERHLDDIERNPPALLTSGVLCGVQ
jgi:hypothetical protein